MTTLPYVIAGIICACFFGGAYLMLIEPPHDVIISDPGDEDEHIYDTI